MKPVRVLHVIDSLHLGGAQEVIYTLVRASTSRFVHEVATLHGRGIFWERMRAAGFTLHSLSPSKYLPLYLPRLWQLLRRGQFSILHCHLGASNILAKPLGRWVGIPAILSHDHTNDRLRIENRWVFRLDQWANGFADAFAAVSESCRNFLIQAEGIPAEKITLVPNAIDAAHYCPGACGRNEARARFGLSPQDLVLAGVGRLNPQKNFALLLEVAAELASDFPQLRLVLAGNGPEEADLRRRAAELGLTKRVVFLGLVEDSRTVYAAADLLVMPSRFEGLPMTLLEALASELPVVASALDGIAEVIESGRNGILVPEGDRDGFVCAIRAALSAPEKRQAMGQAGRKTILQHYSAARMAAQIEHLYDQLLEKADQ